MFKFSTVTSLLFMLEIWCYVPYLGMKIRAVPFFLCTYIDFQILKVKRLIIRPAIKVLNQPTNKELPKTDIKNRKLRGKQIHYRDFKNMTKNKQPFITLARIKFVICIEKRFLTRINFFCDNVINQAQTLSLKIFFESWNYQHFQIRI